jgi:hypothetical protein
MRYKQALKMSNADFKRTYGVSQETFQKMIEVVIKAKLGKRGCHSKLLIADQILLTLQYLREYRTFFHIAQDWGIHESTAWRIVRRIEDVLIKAEEFHLPSKRELQKESTELELVVVDASETEIERPKKKQKLYYSGKQRCHTLKTQLIINRLTREVICTAFGKGRQHDFDLFKKSKIAIIPEIKLLADKGYQGINEYIRESYTPYKRTKNRPLNRQEKKYNYFLNSARVAVENVIRCLKHFRILSSRYRNRGKRFGLRFNLIAGLYNYDLNFGN